MRPLFFPHFVFPPLLLVLRHVRTFSRQFHAFMSVFQLLNSRRLITTLRACSRFFCSPVKRRRFTISHTVKTRPSASPTILSTHRVMLEDRTYASNLPESINRVQYSSISSWLGTSKCSTWNNFRQAWIRCTDWYESWLIWNPLKRQLCHFKASRRSTFIQDSTSQPTFSSAMWNVLVTTTTELLYHTVRAHHDTCLEELKDWWQSRVPIFLVTWKIGVLKPGT